MMRQGDGQGGWRVKPAECQILRAPGRGWTVGFGLAQMDNGEVALLGTHAGRKSLWYRWGEIGWGEPETTIIAFSRDGGDTWTDFEPIGEGRPLLLAYLGGGDLTFRRAERRLSSDYGRTWTSVPLAITGGCEGSPLVDRDGKGRAVRLAEIIFTPDWKPEGAPDFVPGMSVILWSEDGGRTCSAEFRPPNWCSSEGSLVRARNGWLVAALRTRVEDADFPGTTTDEYRCTRVSVSRDDGRTWSDPEPLFQGRMHPHLLCLPDGDIVMTVTLRQDVENGKLVSYRRGCEAVISHDHGLTWELDRRIVLDEWEFYDELEELEGPEPGVLLSGPGFGHTGHVYSTLLDDGAVLTVHNNYLTMGMTLIRWRPE